VGECFVGGLGSSDGWKLVDEWTITKGSGSYNGTEYDGTFNNFKDYDKVRISITGTLSGYRYDGSAGVVGYLSLYNGRRETYQKSSGSTTSVHAVNMVSDFLAIRTDEDVSIMPMGTKSSGVYPSKINAVTLASVDGGDCIPSSNLTVKIYVK